ncbi:S-layer homology domain-containing protein [Trichocoleus sp. FACHB-832]|uniref:S-layer homology domain-containing protein n=1 Tax=Trichocoleus sp. FACHB-832 TaxID=2692875 RepID=UPI001683B0C0|nr:S-layer homology domain-containing protein [Trichocoleus sp. FACHB-832]MBD1907358.1 S-layer homology domain-containing protein [Trichocoleus sp. FACHB-832]
MNRSSFAFLGSMVLAATSLSIATTASALPSEITQAGKSGEQILVQQPAVSPAEEEAVELPKPVADAVLKDIVQRTGVENSTLRVLQVARQTWSNGCLGITTAGVACTEATVPGWVVLVANAQTKDLWIYRANESGSLVKWDEAATKTLTARLRTETTTQERTTTEQRTTSTQPSTVAVSQSAGFSLTVLQPAGTLSDVIARVSLKEKQSNSYTQEKYLGDFKYKIKQKAKFVQGVKPGDRVVVRLYNLQNSLIGYSEFELLSENAAVNLILPPNPSQVRVVRTVYGIDANADGNIDSGTTVYNYYTQINSQERVTFLSSVEQLNLSSFQLSGVSASAATNVYPTSFTSGEYALASQTMSAYSSSLAAVLTSIPGKLVQVVDVGAGNAIYQVSQLLSKYQQVAAAAQTVQTSFVDVPQGHWAKGFIAELASLEIIEGFPDGRFRPDQPVTRAQFAAMIRKAFEKSKVRNAIAFRDVSSNYWAYTAIREAYEMGFLGASGNQFNPTQNLSRLDILVALAKGMNYSSATTTTETLLQVYSDASTIPSSDRSLIAAATERGLVVNYPDIKLLKPNEVATRADVSAFLYQALVSSGKATNITSPYVVGEEAKPQPTQVREVEQTPGDNRQVDDRDRTNQRQNCNQGVGNGPEGCDPGNSNRNQPSNDEGAGAAPGNPGRQGK